MDHPHPQRAATLFVLAALAAPAAASVFLDELTSTELQAQVRAGTTTALLPIGGTEQNGAHMVLGKHNVRVRVLASQIAERLGQTVVAPVLAYVPEGSIDPPAAHMRWAGTISVPPAAFEALLDSAARSLCHHGLRDIVLLGEHGGYQTSLQRVAARLHTPGCRVWALPEYYQASSAGFAALLAERGFSAAEIGTHAGLADTSLALAADPALVRAERLAQPPAAGVAGDPRRASAELGRAGVALIVDRSVAAIRLLRSRAPAQ